MRRVAVVGDPLRPGGQVLPYTGPSSTIHGHRMALIGGRAYCDSCGSVGVIAKAGGPRRGMFYGAEVALEGDVVVCQCRTHPQIVSVLQTTSTCDDLGGALSSTLGIPNFGSVTGSSVAALKKTADGPFSHEAEPSESICPNMTDKQFAEEVLTLRDRAAALATERLSDLGRWDRNAQTHVKKWFGQANDEVRGYLQNGIHACIRVLRDLKATNFVRYVEGDDKHTGCSFPSNADLGTAAAVCKPDLATRTIAIAPKFCALHRDKVIFGSSTIKLGDSQLLTLVHEVTHFQDVFNSNDTWYTSSESLYQIKNASNYRRALQNADSLASYILNRPGF
ncbi:PAAR domain-containing protein [Variovorax sp. GT1P44]|uniref:PAAR domain-containing protein n=1 Tax=Variovorax sp. GT1P44 TaxID=3443742 RepID=UPI003F467230